MSLPDPSLLTALVAAHGQRSLAKAAAELGLSPGELSAQLSQLEGSFGEQLLVREGDGVALTEAGKRLLPQAQRALRELRRCAELLSEPLGSKAYELTLGTRYELGMSWLVPALDTLAQDEPDRRLHLSFGDTRELLLRLDRGEIDAFISSARISRDDLDHEPLHAEDYAFVAAPSLLRGRPLKGAADAPDHVLVDISGDLPLFRYLLEALGDEEGWPFAHLSCMGTIAAIRARVLRGAGVAVLPLYFIRYDLDEGRLTRLMPWLALRQDVFRLIWRADSPREHALRALGRTLARVELR